VNVRNQQVLKLFLVLVLCITYIFSFSHFGAQAYDSVMKQNDQFTEGTKIGSLSVGGKSYNEALKLTDEQLTKWLNGTVITLKFKEQSNELDLSNFMFDIENTVSQAKQGQENPVIVELNSLEDSLLNLTPSLTVDTVDIETLQSKILQGAKTLEAGNYEIRIDEYMVNEDFDELSIVSEAIIQSEHTNNELDLFVDKSIEIVPVSQFSLLNYVESEIGEVSSFSLSKIATALYKVILPTNFDIIERHISRELPEYAELGFEAKADIDLKNDLVFSNPNEFSYFIDFVKKNDSVHVYLRGIKLLNSYKITPDEKETFKPKIIRQFNPQLGPTEIKVKVEGKVGQLIKVYREHLDEQGALLKKELISEDFYPPIHQVEVQGLIISEESASPSSNSNEGEAVDSPANTLDPNNTSNNPPEDSDSMKESDLWGKENEIPK
jgi:hypothetical protein